MVPSAYIPHDSVHVHFLSSECYLQHTVVNLFTQAQPIEMRVVFVGCLGGLPEKARLDAPVLLLYMYSTLLYSPVPEIPPVRAHLPEEARILKTQRQR